MQKSQAITASHEDLIVQRYEWLLRWALEISGGDREEAEDLVQEVFVHFTLDRPDLAAVTQNLEGYLYAMLRNMHISGIRRTTRQQNANASMAQLAVSEHESIEDELRAVEERELDVQDRLRRICEYACIRKETSKAGSVLILRFFLGYYPAEIAEILRSPRGAINEWLRTARAEARLYLTDPDSLSFMTRATPKKPSFTESELMTEDLVRELHHAIFNSPAQTCLTPTELENLYRAADGRKIETAVLTHVVSCRTCLDVVNTLLGLPLLASRYPIKVLGKDSRPRGKSGGGQSGGGSGGASSGDGLITRSRRRLKKVIEHHPQTLRVAVNGFVVGSQKVGLRSNEQVISVNIEEKIGFVEIFSEQDVRMLFSTVAAPPEGPIEHKKRIALSEGRNLELSLSFSDPWPSLRVVYFDPSLQENEAQLSNATLRAEGNAVTDSSESRVPARTPIYESLKSLTKRLRGLMSDWTVWRRPGVVTMILAALMLAVAFVVLRSPHAPVSAADLLQRSTEAEQADTARTDQVLHRTINLEERRGDGGELISSRKLEVWQSAEKGVKALRVYDEKGFLIAGEWSRNDGSRTVYHHGLKPQPQPMTAAPSNTPLDLDNVWQLEPSAKQFTALTQSNGQTASLVVQERPATYVLSYDGEATQPRGVIKAALTLSRADLHAIEQTLTVKRGDEVREYRLTEASFERRAPNAVAPSVFELEPELSALPASGTGKGAELTSKERAELRPTQPMRAIATAELEVEVLRLLSQAGADLGEQVSVTRTPDGPLVVQGIVDTDQRKGEILRGLSSVDKNPAVQIEITTVAEALRRQPVTGRQSTPTTVERVEASSTAIPVDAELRRYLSSRGTPANEIDEEISRFARRTMGQSLNALQHAWALKRLAERFSAEDLRTLTPDARSKWLSMIHQHAQVLEHEIANLRAELNPVFPGVSSIDAGDEPSVGTTDQELQQAIARLFELCSGQEQAIRSAFAVARTSSGASVVRSAQFWRSLHTAEKLAMKISSRQ